jgi:3-(3-hydroxy-phenyl)propionate hydroxylase
MLNRGETETDMLDDAVIYQLMQQASATLPDEEKGLEHVHTLRIIRKAVYTFHTMISESFMVGRVFLLGDAAHLMPPFGGQGMNSGLRDAYNLCWKLVQVIQKQANSHILATYQQERQPHAIRMALFSSALGNLIMPTQPLRAYLRDFVLHTINTYPPARQHLSEMRVKPPPRYTRGLLLPSHLTVYSARTGMLLPQPFVQTAQGTSIRLDEVLGHHFILVGLYEEQKNLFTRLTDTIWDRLDTRFICLCRREQDMLNPLPERGKREFIPILDRTNQISSLLHHNPNVLMLLRPDHYIMGIFPVTHIHEIQQALRLRLFSEK